MELTEEQIERYSRQIILPEIGGEGQKKLFKARVLIIGCGGLGSPVSLYLAAAGVGKIGLVDSDSVELNNLQRQVVHFTEDVGTPKVDSAKRKLNAINPDVEIVPWRVRLTSENIMEILKDYDIVVDGSDNFPTRYLVNDACVFLRKPFSHAGILRFYGQATTILPFQGPCYRCIFAQPPPPGMVPSCQEAGIIGPIGGLLGMVQALEVIKFIVGKGELLIGKLLIIDALKMEIRKVNVKRNPACPVCGDNPVIKELIDYEEFCGLRRER